MTPGQTIPKKELKDNIGQKVIVLYSDGSRRFGKITFFDDKNKKIRIEKHKDHFWVDTDESASTSILFDHAEDEQRK